MMIEDTLLEGCFLLSPKVFQDERGMFVKNFHSSTFLNLGLETIYAEDFYSISHRDVLRGMHFQKPPHDHAKLVSCITGKILDVIVDLRPKSSTFKKHVAIELDGNSPKAIYIPKGCAHGFLSLADNSYVNYKTSTEHSTVSDSGIRWDSFGYQWPCAAPIMSNRDKNFPSFGDSLLTFE